MNIEILWSQCMQHNRKAQFELYNLFSSPMLAVCTRYVQDRAQAEDILQMGFVKVFTKGHLYQGKGSLEGWIRRIMVNTAIEVHRQQLLHKMDPLTVEHPEVSAEPNALAKLHYQELLALVHALPIGYRTIFNLYAIEGYTHKEIAELLHISEGNSKSQLSRARQWLKNKISQQQLLER